MKRYVHRDPCSLQSSATLSSTDVSISRWYHHLARSFRIVTRARWPAIGNATIHRAVSHYWRITVSFARRRTSAEQKWHSVQPMDHWMMLRASRDFPGSIHQCACTGMTAGGCAFSPAPHGAGSVRCTRRHDSRKRGARPPVPYRSLRLLRPLYALFPLRSLFVPFASKNFPTFLAPVSTSRSHSRVNR